MLRAAVIILGVLAVCQGFPRRQPNRLLPRRNDDIDTHIVGGNEVDISDHPYTISMMIYDSHYCGGSVLTTSFILTAGHCVLYAMYDPENVVVRAGSSSLTGGQLSSVVWADNHPNYHSSYYSHDVGLLKLKSPLTVGPNVRPVRLVAANAEPRAGSKAIVSGWGLLHRDDLDLPENLSAVLVPIVPRCVCVLSYGEAGSNVDNTMICAGVGGKDACQGDSGSPLVDVVSRTQIGIVSWGIGCASPGYPGVYANLANPELRSWIVKRSGLVE